jgi:hypothetical protein
MSSIRQRALLRCMQLQGIHCQGRAQALGGEGTLSSPLIKQAGTLIITKYVCVVVPGAKTRQPAPTLLRWTTAHLLRYCRPEPTR